MSIVMQVKMSSKNYRAPTGKFNFFTVAITICCGRYLVDHSRSKKVFLASRMTLDCSVSPNLSGNSVLFLD